MKWGECWGVRFVRMYFELQILCIDNLWHATSWVLAVTGVLQDFCFFWYTLRFCLPLFLSQMVLQNVDKAQVKLKMRKDNVVGVWDGIHTLCVHTLTQGLSSRLHFRSFLILSPLLPSLPLPFLHPTLICPSMVTGVQLPVFVAYNDGADSKSTVQLLNEYTATCPVYCVCVCLHMSGHSYPPPCSPSFSPPLPPMHTLFQHMVSQACLEEANKCPSVRRCLAKLSSWW